MSEERKIVFVGDLVQKTEAEMLRTPNFGRRSLNETKDVLVQMGLHLGMEIPGWLPENVEELAKRFEDHYRGALCPPHAASHHLGRSRSTPRASSSATHRA